MWLDAREEEQGEREEGATCRGRLGRPPSSPPYIAQVGASRWALVGPTLGSPFQVGCSKPPPKVQLYGPLKAH